MWLISTTALQYAESLATYSETVSPWDMQGSFLTDTSLIEGLSLQQALRYSCSLRLALMYDAPQHVQEDIITKGRQFAVSAAVVTYGTEWRFLVALHCLRFHPEDPRIQDSRDHLCTMPLSKYSLFVKRRSRLKHQTMITRNALTSLTASKCSWATSSTASLRSTS
jgi:hypothetical protein